LNYEKFACVDCHLISSCTGIPDGVTAIDAFEINRYMGTWYEIARLDHRFEKV